MARQPRIQLPGAVYYCSAQGIAGQPIAPDKADRDAYESMLSELVGKTGWTLFAWTLLDSAYHLVFRTPEPNLVEGMRWLQNSWVKHFNSRHHRSGSLFANRYRSVLVEEDRFLPALIDYIHLFPFRENLVTVEAGLAQYHWSSLRDYFLPETHRRDWVQAATGLLLMGYASDTGEERARYLDHLERTSREAGGIPPLSHENLPDLRATLQRGPCLGTRAFRREIASRRQHSSSSAASLEDDKTMPHGRAIAMLLLRTGLAIEGLTRESLEGLKKSDWRKRAIGRAIRRCTTAPIEWIADNLNMGVSSRVAQLVGEDPRPSWGKNWKRAQTLMETVEELCHGTSELLAQPLGCNSGDSF